MKRLRDWLSCFVPAVPWLITAVLIVAVLMILVSALRPKAHAQFGGVQQPIFSTASEQLYTPLSEPSIRYWWVASDIATNALMTNWVDRIQYLPMTNTAAASPVNTANGAMFDGTTQFLRPTNHFLDTFGVTGTGSVVVVCVPLTPVSTYGPLVSGDSNVGDDGDRGPKIKNDGNIYYYGLSSFGNYGTWQDGIPLTYGISISATITDSIYTNGVLNSTPGDGSIGYQGFVGKSTYSGTDYYYNGYIREIMWFSNYLSAASHSNLNAYAVRVYGTNSASFVNNWPAKVVANGGAVPSASTIAAVDAFYDGLRTNSLLPLMVSVNCFATDSVVAASTPLYKVAGYPLWTNNFVAGDLTVNGLVGDGSSKYMDTGIIPASASPISTTSAGLSVMIFNQPNDDAYALGVSGAAAFSAFGAGNWQGTVFFNCWRYDGSSGQDKILATKPTTWAAFLSGNRTAADAIAYYGANSTNTFETLGSGTTAQTGAAIATYPLYVLAQNAAGTPADYSSARVSFVAVHSGLTLTQSSNLYNLVVTMRNALGGGVP